MESTIKYNNLIFLFLLVSCSAFHSFGQHPKSTARTISDSIEVVQTINAFVDAFSNLHWQQFTRFFAEDATAFFPPSANIPEKVNNKDEILKVFRNVFDHAKKLKSTPPYIIIEPKNLSVQMLGKTAVITFVLEDPEMFGRRTIVMEKEHNRWLIVHLHASGVPAPK